MYKWQNVWNKNENYVNQRIGLKLWIGLHIYQYLLNCFIFTTYLNWKKWMSTVLNIIERCGWLENGLEIIILWQQYRISIKSIHKNVLYLNMKSLNIAILNQNLIFGIYCAKNNSNNKKNPKISLQVKNKSFNKII